MSILETKGLCKSYSSNSVLSDVDLQIDNGNSLLLWGNQAVVNQRYCIVSVEWISRQQEEYVLMVLIWQI